MSRIFKALSALLTYPTADLQAAAPEIGDLIAKENAFAGRVRESLMAFAAELGGGELYDLQERYVLLFDRTRSLSLHLFEHVHGESRDRGQAMIDLKNLYEKNGLTISAAELPDFLPLLLEYLSTRPRAEACAMLAQTSHITSALAERLRKRKSSYEATFRALVVLSAVKPESEAVAALLQESDSDATDLAALDAAWEDEPVSFGPGAGDSCKDQLIAKIRAGRRPAPGLERPTAARTAPSHQ